jgi:hypothetical protein
MQPRPRVCKEEFSPVSVCFSLLISAIDAIEGLFVKFCAVFMIITYGKDRSIEGQMSLLYIDFFLFPCHIYSISCATFCLTACKFL